MRKKMTIMALILGVTVGSMNLVSANDDYVFENNKDGTCKIIKTGKFENVEELSVPIISADGKQVTELEDYTFYKCEAQTFILSNMEGELNNGILEYGECKNIVIENCKLKIGDNFASNMEDIESLTITNCELEFDDYAFFKLGDDAVVNISNSKVEFDSAAFEYSGIKEMTIDSCEIKADGSFMSNSEDLTLLIMKDSSLEFKDYAFYKLGDKAEVSITGCTGEFENAVFEYAEIAELYLDNCELEFGNSAFSNNDKLKKIKVEDGKYFFGEYSFYKCSRADEFIIGGQSKDNEYEIDDAFGEYCSKLQSLELGEGKFEIGSNFFANCKLLSEVTISEKCDLEIEDYAFYGASENLQIFWENQEYDIVAFSSLIN